MDKSGWQKSFCCLGVAKLKTRNSKLKNTEGSQIITIETPQYKNKK